MTAGHVSGSNPGSDPEVGSTSMDRLLRRVAEGDRLVRRHPTRRQRRSPCLAAWQVLAWAAQAPEQLATWWAAHGSRCAACGWTVERVGRENAELTEMLRHLTGTSAVPAEQVLRLRGAHLQILRLAWAAATPAVPARSEPLPVVTFRSIAPATGSGCSAAWLVAWDARCFVLVTGDDDGLDRWRDGARAVSSAGEIVARFVPAQPDVRDALCPGERLGDASCVCLESQGGVGPLTSAPVALPGLVAGTLRLEPDGAPESSVDAAVIDLTSRNRVSRFLDAIRDEPTDAGTRMTVAFYLRVLSAQGRIPTEARDRLVGLPWLDAQTRCALRGGAA